jgi:hypothetical protein
MGWEASHLWVLLLALDHGKVRFIVLLNMPLEKQDIFRSTKLKLN